MCTYIEQTYKHSNNNTCGYQWPPRTNEPRTQEPRYRIVLRSNKSSTVYWQWLGHTAQWWHAAVTRNRTTQNVWCVNNAKTTEPIELKYCINAAYKNEFIYRTISHFNILCQFRVGRRQSDIITWVIFRTEYSRPYRYKTTNQLNLYILLSNTISLNFLENSLFFKWNKARKS